jgi:hypothetical protein
VLLVGLRVIKQIALDCESMLETIFLIQLKVPEVKFVVVRFEVFTVVTMKNGVF